MRAPVGDATDPGGPDADEALTLLFRAHYSDLLGLAVVLTGDRASAEDLVQDVFARTYRHWHRVRDHERALAYLRAGVANGARSRLRRIAVARRHASPPPADIASAEEHAVLAEEHAEVLRELHRLPGRQRQVLAMRYYADLDDAAIAAALSIAPSSVRVHAHRGLAALTRKLGTPR